MYSSVHHYRRHMYNYKSLTYKYLTFINQSGQYQITAHYLQLIDQDPGIASCYIIYDKLHCDTIK